MRNKVAAENGKVVKTSLPTGIDLKCYTGCRIINEAAIVRAYYESYGSLSEACRKTETNFFTVKALRETNKPFDAKLRQIDTLLTDIVHHQFMQKVLTPDTNPVWKRTYLTAHDPRYGEKTQKRVVEVRLTDQTFKRAGKVIEGEVVKAALAP